MSKDRYEIALAQPEDELIVVDHKRKLIIARSRAKDSGWLAELVRDANVGAAGGCPWISVETPPPELIVCLVGRYGSTAMAALWCDRRWHAGTAILTWEPTHWMPLPVVPKP